MYVIYTKSTVADLLANNAQDEFVVKRSSGVQC